MTDQSIWIFVCSEYRHFLRWCEYENDPPLNPKDKRFVVLTSDSMDCVNRSRGRYLKEGDRLIKHFMWQDGRYADVLREVLAPIEVEFVAEGGKVEHVTT